MDPVLFLSAVFAAACLYVCLMTDIETREHVLALFRAESLFVVKGEGRSFAVKH